MQDYNEIKIDFPCEFPIKIMGPSNVEFQGLIFGIIRQHSPDIGEGAFRIRHSKEGRYISITVIIQAKSKQQIDNLYMALSAEKSVLMLL